MTVAVFEKGTEQALVRLPAGDWLDQAVRVLYAMGYRLRGVGEVRL